MATAREQPSTSRNNNNPYEANGGGGGFGKFKKKPFLKSNHQATPYARPLTALRNTNGNGNRGWLSKIVDPAQRFITASAHRFFDSVFQKRLTAPPPDLPPLVETGRNHEARDDRQTPVLSKDPNALLGRPTCGPDKASTSSDHGGLTELEQILQQKTFTRSEIEHLTSLLHSRTIDPPTGNEEKRSEIIPLKQMTTCAGPEQFLKTAAQNNGVGSHFTSSPATNLQILDEDIASPAELAKAYMGNVPSKVSPSMLGLRGQALREDSPLSSRTNLSKSPIMALVPRSSGYVGARENGLVTPRSRGRSAIYSMARTPYARVQSPASIMGAGPASDVSYTPSSSKSGWEQNRLSVSRQGALKRRNSFLDNDIGSAGPIRRIRQKSNLQPPKNLSLPVSETPLSTKGSGTGSDRPSKSSDMATRILEQLDKLVSPKEKSSRKLSPSMLRAPALKSLVNVDTSHVLENALGDSKKDGVFSTIFTNTRDTMLPKSRLEENGPRIPQDLYGMTTSVANGVQTSDLSKDIQPAARITDTEFPQKQAFKMSAHEGCLVLDDDEHPNGVVATPLLKGREKIESVRMEKEGTTSEGTMNGKPLVPTAAETLSNSIFNQKAVQMPTTGKSVSFALLATAPSSTTSQLGTQSTPISDGLVSVRGSNAFPPQYAVTSSKAVSSSGFDPVSNGATESVPEVTESEKAENKNILKNAPSSAADMFSFGGTSNNSSLNNNGSIALFSTASPPVSSNVANINSSSNSLSSSAALPSITNSSIFKFASSVVPSTSAPLLSAASETKTEETSNPLVGAASVIPNTDDSILGTSSTGGPGSRIFGNTPSTTSNITSNLVGGTGASFSAFGDKASPAATSLSENSSRNATNNFQGNSNGSGFASLNQSAPNQSGSSTSASPFGSLSSTANLCSSGITPPTVAGNGSRLFGSDWQAPKSSVFSSPFSSASPSTGFAFGASSASASASASSSFVFSFTSSTPDASTQPVVGNNASNNNSPMSLSPGPTGNSNDQMRMEDGMAEDTVQGAAAPSFGQQPVSTPPSSFVFGSTPPSAANPFGSTAPSTANPFGATTTPGATTTSGANPFAFTTPSAANPFGLTDPSGANPFASTITCAVNLFGSTANPFGSTAPSGTTAQSGTNPFPFGGQTNSNSNSNPNLNANPSGATAQSGANPFQFGGQLNPNPNANPSPSPFQASGSVGGTGSFSLGTSGGDKSGRKIIKVNRSKLRRK
ncbi:hypothetical protein ACFE04_009752 [Oxalis oulophora]